MEPVTLTVGQIRDEIRRASFAEQLARASGQPSNAILGRIFHETFAGLMSTPRLSWQAVMDSESLSDRGKLSEHVYDKLLGPRLMENQAALRERGGEVLNLWQAAQEMTDWLGKLLEVSYRDGLISFDYATGRWSGTDNLCLCERTVSWTLRDADWTRPVQICGVPDAIWRNPRSGNWCVVEYKLGRTHAEADLTQACLYHMMLQAGGWTKDAGTDSLAVISFLPQREERFFEGAKLEEAQRTLRGLIGRLAGVLPGHAETEPEVGSEAPPLQESHQELGHKLVQTLQQYGPVVELRGSPIVGPTFLRYTIMPDAGVKVATILNKAEDLQIRLGLEHPPMIQKAGGKLVIDVQRPDRQQVTFSSIRSQLPAPDNPSSRSKVLLGTDLFGRLQFANLEQTPHLLVAGTSGSGKTEWLRAAIAGLIGCNTPQSLRLVLIDPKRQAFGDLKASPFLWNDRALVHPPDDPVLAALDGLIDEMEERYRIFAGEKAGDLSEFVAKWGYRKPRIVCLCDEYADLVAIRRERREVEERIRRLGAKARAAGIHLIIATQYPRADIVDGALKANLPGRVCLRTTTHTQSNVVIGRSGAERLLGKGDLFWVDIGEPVRLQAPLLTAEERARIFGSREEAAMETTEHETAL